MFCCNLTSHTTHQDEVRDVPSVEGCISVVHCTYDDVYMMSMPGKSQDIRSPPPVCHTTPCAELTLSFPTAACWDVRHAAALAAVLVSRACQIEIGVHRHRVGGWMRVVSGVRTGDCRCHCFWNEAADRAWASCASDADQQAADNFGKR